MGTTPTQIQQTQYGFAPVVEPYAQDLLAMASAVTDVNENPYMQYMGERFAQFTPMQQRAFESAEMLEPSKSLEDASALAGMAGLAGLGLQGAYNPIVPTMMYANQPTLQNFTMSQPSQVSTTSFTAPGAASTYMNPYMEQVLAPQLQAMQRQADIQRQTLGAQAAQAGAFGGARSVLGNQQLNAELMRQQQQATGQAYGQAFGQAQQQFNQEQQARLQAQLANQQAGINVAGQNLQSLLGVQQLGGQLGMQAQLANQQALQNAQQLAEQSRQYSANLGLQGLNTALQGAGQLGQLGGQQFGQVMNINQLMNQYGTQQQQQAQNILNQQYQDFLNAQNYPYKQLGFMSDIIRGVPLTQTGTTLYQAPPSAVSQLAGLGTAAYGFSQLGRAKGGTVSSEPKGLAALMISKIK